MTATPLLDRISAGHKLSASDVPAAVHELDQFGAPGEFTVLRVFVHPESGKTRCVVALTAHPFVISDSIEDALLTARKLVSTRSMAEVMASEESAA